MPLILVALSTRPVTSGLTQDDTVPLSCHLIRSPERKLREARRPALNLTVPFQHLDEQRPNPRQKAPPEGCDRVVVGMVVGGDEAEGDRVIGRPFQLAAGKHPGGAT